MVTPALKATVDQLSEDERRDLLHYLEQTVDDDAITLTSEQITELERRDAELASGSVSALSAADLVQRARDSIR